jgi:hypothetical protein
MTPERKSQDPEPHWRDYEEPQPTLAGCGVLVLLAVIGAVIGAGIGAYIASLAPPNGDLYFGPPGESIVGAILGFVIGFLAGGAILAAGDPRNFRVIFWVLFALLGLAIAGIIFLWFLPAYS